MNHGLLLAFVQATIIINMLAIGLDQSRSDLTWLWRHPGRLLRSLVAVVVLVPVAALAIIGLFPLPIATATGLAILAAAPGAPLTYKRSAMAGADTRYVASLQLSLAAVAVVVTPLTLLVFDMALDLATGGVSFMYVARQVATVQLVPVSLALVVVWVFPGLAERVKPWISRLGNVLLVLLLLIALVPGLRLLLSAVGGGGIVAILLLAVLALAIGHVMGGPAPGERSGLAIACIARNLGLAIFIGMLPGIEVEVMPTIAAFALIGGAVAIPYSLRAKRKSPRPSGGGGDKADHRA